MCRHDAGKLVRCVMAANTSDSSDLPPLKRSAIASGRMSTVSQKRSLFPCRTGKTTFTAPPNAMCRRPTSSSMAKVSTPLGTATTSAKPASTERRRSGSTGKPPSREQLINTSGYLRASRSTSCKNAFALFSSKVLTTRPGVSAAGLQALMSCSTSFGRVGSMGSVTFALTSSVFSNTEHSIGLPAPSWRSPTSVIHFRPDTV